MTRSRRVLHALTIAPFVAFIVIVAFAVNTMHSEQKRVLNQGFEEHADALLAPLEHQSRHLIETFDWPLLLKLQMTALEPSDVEAAWIVDRLSGKTFGEPAKKLDNLVEAEYRMRPITSDNEVIGSVHLILSKAHLQEALARADRSALAVVVSSTLFSGLVLYLFFYFREREGRKIRDFEALVARTTEELHVNEELLSAVLDNIPSAVVLRQPNGTILRINKEYEKVFDLSNTIARGKQLSDIHDQETAEQCLANDREILAQENIFRSELRVTHGDQVRYFDMLKFPILDPSGKVIAIGGINHDITERKQADKELHTALNNAEQANKAKSEFLANMSHELRTPLNAVIGYSQALQEETFGPVGSAKNKEYIDTINGAGDHLLSIIGDILDLSKVEAGEETIIEEVLDVRKFIQECEIMTSERAVKKGLRLVTLVDEDVHMLLADRLRVKQVLLNLLSNAIKFTPPHGKVSIHAYLQANSSTVIKVSDTGIGIAPEELASVMQPFAQAGDANTRSHEGSGLGLSLVQRMVDLHNGGVTLQSTLGEGTIVSVKFPPERTITG